MKSYSIIYLVTCVSMMQACHSPSNATDGGHFGARFNVQIADVYAFNQQSKRAKSLNYRNDMWEFRGNMMLLRMAGHFNDESSESSQDLTYNNVLLQFNHVVDGKKTSVSCKPNQRPKGTITRITHADQSSSGTFRLEFERCHQTYTEQAIKEFPMPLVVTGTFNKLPIRDALF